ncbi:MAG: hypothetical protein JWO31_3205 [Phycisphaerales bacterium]|nr:hypothetical protein [Phycisphaerales bacterium]
MARALLARSGGRGMTPLEQAAEIARTLNAGPAAGGYAPPEFSPPVPLDDLGDDDLVRQIEAGRARRNGRVMADWLAAVVVGFRTFAALDETLDQAGWVAPEVRGDPVAVVLALSVFWEAEWLARAVWPQFFERPEPATPDEPQYLAPRTAADAAAAGLREVRRRHRPRPNLRTPTLPGCKGGFITSPTHVCPELRVRGHDYCPTCGQLLDS